MKIAQIAPLIESVPPRLYGGTERIVSYLTEELVSLGHEVTLFASGDSISRAKLVSCCTRAFRLDESVSDYIPQVMMMIDKVQERVQEFDIVHFHIDLFHFPLFHSLAAQTLATLHGRQDLGVLKPFYSRFGAMPLVSISNDQRKSLPHANFVATIHHGIPANLLAPSFQAGNYLGFLGRISPEKRPDLAIRIARAAGVPLKIAAKIDKVDHEYFYTKIRPLIDGRSVEYIGEINELEKAKFLGGAAALLFPIDWPEPFGLVMIEANGVWHAGPCIPLWVGARDRRKWHNRQGGRQRRKSHCLQCRRFFPMIAARCACGLRKGSPPREWQKTISVPSARCCGSARLVKHGAIRNSTLV
jgi:glycosyltransferase involved in cell wall biosynthesis